MAEKKETPEILTGTVKWFSARRGYGFVTDEYGVDYFAHFSEIQMDGFKKLYAGQGVTFQAAKDEHERGLARCIVPDLDGEYQDEDYEDGDYEEGEAPEPEEDAEEGEEDSQEEA